MKNLFEIDSDEIKRILSLHETSTKQQYLNLISETRSQTQAEIDAEYASKNGKYDLGVNSYTLVSNINLENTKINTHELKIFKGTVFTQSGKQGILKSNTIKFQYVNTGSGQVEKANSGVVYYKCQTGKFFIPGNNESFYFDGADIRGPIAQGVKKVCIYKPVGPNQKPSGSGPVDPKLEKAQKCGHKSYADYQKSNWACTPTPTVDPKLEKAQKCGHKSWEEYQKSNWTCSASTETVVDDSKLTPRQKEYKDKVYGINKQIQVALGVQDGNGTLTQADYQAIYNKLLQ